MYQACDQLARRLMGVREGVLVRYRSPGGERELIFDTEEEAEKWCGLTKAVTILELKRVQAAERVGVRFSAPWGPWGEEWLFFENEEQAQEWIRAGCPISLSARDHRKLGKDAVLEVKRVLGYFVGRHWVPPLGSPKKRQVARIRG